MRGLVRNIINKNSYLLVSNIMLNVLNMLKPKNVESTGGWDIPCEEATPLAKKLHTGTLKEPENQADQEQRDEELLTRNFQKMDRDR
ncbi:hypothetical protein HHI36_009337 [Cryptolaemus montrouzieri]|uniref:Uncharacterized protein n=1 Tax=Cryptolaemus montrouzieri TaxID=559131 RepID=A0ABD2MUY7_9CUCU